jgi:hypothetical protein
MVIARERYLDDSSRFHLTLELTTRTGDMHSLLTGAGAETHARLGEILVRALTDIASVLAPHVSGPAPARETSTFGCGT